VDHKEIVEFPTDGITSNSSFEMRMNIQTPGASVMPWLQSLHQTGF
jgi:hypothetical protein